MSKTKCPCPLELFFRGGGDTGINRESCYLMLSALRGSTRRRGPAQAKWPWQACQRSWPWSRKSFQKKKWHKGIKREGIQHVSARLSENWSVVGLQVRVTREVGLNRAGGEDQCKELGLYSVSNGGQERVSSRGTPWPGWDLSLALGCSVGMGSGWSGGSRTGRRGAATNVHPHGGRWCWLEWQQVQRRWALPRRQTFWDLNRLCWWTGFGGNERWRKQRALPGFPWLVVPLGGRGQLREKSKLGTSMETVESDCQGLNPSCAIDKLCGVSLSKSLSSVSSPINGGHNSTDLVG